MEETIVRRKLYLEGLDCAHCAGKIEKQTNELPGVEKASLNFTTKNLLIDFENDAQVAEVIEHTHKIIRKLEPDVVVTEVSLTQKSKPKEAENNANNAFLFSRVALGAVILLVEAFGKFNNSVSLTLTLMSYALIGGDVVWRAVRNIAKGQLFDENFLMTVATVGAFFIGEYPEAVSVMLFYQIGEYFQDRAVHQSRKSIANLMDIRPDFAWLFHGGEWKKVPPEMIAVGDRIQVKPGERVPLDGHILKGQSALDTAALTGESYPRDVLTGDSILSGSINLTGLLEIEVDKTYSESTVSKILELVENATSNKAKTENFITKFAYYYTPSVVGIAVLLAIVPPFLFHAGDFSEWLRRALVFLVVSCPCALVISIPLSFFGGIGAASKRGILIKGSQFLEGLNQVTTIVFDKTGTLTEGRFSVVDITHEEVLPLAYALEQHSNHPIALAIQKKYKEVYATMPIQNQELVEISQFKEELGFGITGVVVTTGENIYLGNEAYMKKLGIVYGASQPIEGASQLFIAKDKTFLGAIFVADQLKSDTKETLQHLRNSGIKTVLLSGDQESIVQKIAKELNISEAYGGLLPQDKVNYLEKIMSENGTTSKIGAKIGKSGFTGKTIFVGDGINDAAVLARADIGIAMGALGSDAAIESADVVLMTDELAKISEAITIAAKTRKIVWQNIVFALGIKALVLLLAAVGVANLWEAVFADVGVALLAVLNAMRIVRE